MRKSFTRLFSIFILFCLLGFQALAQSSWDPGKSIPKEDNVTDLSVTPESIATQFVVAFTAAPTITTAGGTLAVYKDGNIIKTIAVTSTSPDVSVVGSTLVVKHGITSFVEKSTYEIRLPAGAVKVGTSDVAIAAGAWNFTIGDFTAPKLFATNPLAPVGTGAVANLTINGSANSMSLMLKFDEAVQKGTGKIAIYKANGTVVELIDVATATNITISGSTVTVPVSDLARFEENTSYYVKVEAGAFTDIISAPAPAVVNKYAGINTTTAWTFTTRDNSAPAITASVTDVTTTTAKLNVSLAEAGTIKWLVATSAPANETGFTAVSGALAANTTKVISVPATGTLTGGTTYYAYVIATNSVSTNPNKTSLATAIANRIEFKTVDNTGPVTYGTTGTPANGRGLINTNKQTTGLFIYFNEQVKGGTGNLSVRKVSDNTLIYSIPASAVTCSKVTTTGDTWINKYKAVVNFGGSLASKENYYVVFPEGYIEDMSGNDYVSSNNAATASYPVPLNYSDWVITSSDYEAPVVSFYSTSKPTETAGNIDGIANTDNIFIKFNEAVTLVDGTAWSAVTDWSKYVAFQQNGVTVAAAYSCDGSVLTIDPTSLTSNAAYSVILRPGVVKDANSNILTAGKSITVTTGDNETLAATFGPTTSLGEYTPLTIAFNKAVRAITTTAPNYTALTDALAKSYLTLEQSIGGAAYTPVAAADYTATYDATANKITVVPVSGKPFATSSEASTIKYKLTLAADKIEDNAGNNLAAASKEYTVADYKKPVVTLVASEFTGANPTISFSEPVYLVAGVGSPSVKDQLTLKLIDNQGVNLDFSAALVGNVITITPTVAFELNKTYYYGIGASMKDLAGNVIDPAFKSFTVTAVAPTPTVTALTYTVNSGATNYNIGSGATPATGVVEQTTINGLKFVVNFSQAISLLNAQTVTTTFTDGTSVINANAISQSSIDGSKLTITIPASVVLASQTDYTVYVPEGLVIANATYNGTDYATQPAFSFTVTSKDIVNPQISTLSPSGTDVPLTWGADGLKIKFSEKVALGAGNITITPAGGTATTIAVSASTVSLDATSATATVTVSPLDKYYTVYTVAVAAGAFKDLTGNTLTGTLSYTFTTVPNPQPAVANNGLYPADNSDKAPTSLDLTMTFTEPVAKASTIGSRKLVYVIKDGGSAGGSYIDAAGDIHVATDDSQVYTAYVDDDAKVVVSGNAVTIKGVTLAADSKYYVLITPGAFKDLSAGNGVTAYGSPATDYPVPGIYGGIATDNTVWNFQTGDVLAPTVALSFTKLGADGFPTTDSDIKLTFSKPIVKKVGSDFVAITNSDIPSLIKLEKLVGSTWNNLAFTGSINSTATEITIDNSSLVVLNEMVGNTNYRVSFAATTLFGQVSQTALGSYSDTFWTTDKTAPAAPVVSYVGGEVAAISYNSTDGHVAALNIAATDANSAQTNHTAIKVYYLKSASNLTLSATDVKGLADANKALTADGNFDVTFKGAMESKSTYYVYAVSEDVAGNLSTVTKFSFITDDVVKPVLAGALPTAFNSTKQVSLLFNEAVSPVAGAKARIIDNDNKITYYVNLLQGTASTDAAVNAKTIVTDVFNLIDADVASYTVEIDGGMIVDVPRQVSSVNVNNPNAFDGITGTSFVVTSSDKTAPVLVTPAYGVGTLSLTNVDANPVFTFTFSEPVTLATSFTSAAVLDSNGNPYDLIGTANVGGLGTTAITLTPSRTYVSEGTYGFVIPNGMFKDMNGNAWNQGSMTVTFTVKDVLPLAATFKAGTTALPASAALTSVPETLTIDLGESFFINPNDAVNNTYDLQQHVYLKQGDTNLTFTATASGTTIVLSGLNGSGLGDAAKGKTYTFGFTNLYDDAKIVNAGQEASFSVAADAVVPWKVKFTPGDNDNDTPTVSKVGISVDQLFTVEFNGIIFSYDANDEAKNNLIMTASLLNSLGTFTLTTAPSGSTLNVVSYSEATGKSVVTLQCSKPLASQTDYTLTLNPNKIQIGQGHTALTTYVETFTTADVTAPKLAFTVVNNVEVVNASSYLPNNGGTVGKDQTLGLVFTEPVVGAGNLEIHRWDGVLVATVDITGKTGTTSAPNTLNIAKISDLMTSANPLFVTNNKYYVIVPVGSVVDKATVPNAFAGITAVNAWSFDLRDDAHPIVTFVDNGKKGIATNTDIKLTFDRPVNGNWGFLAIYTEDGNAVQLLRIPPVAGTVSGTTWTPASNVMAYNVDINNLNENTKYLLELGEGSFVLNADNATPQLAIAKGDWWFSTEINTAPVATDFVPAKATPMTSGVLLNSDLKITFDQEVMAGTGNIQLHQKQAAGGPIITNFNVADPTKVVFSGNTLTIPSAVLGLQENSEYYVIVPSTAVKNTSPTAEYYAGLTVPFEWSFSTVNDATAPTLTVTAPAAPVAKVFTVGLKFSEPVTGVVSGTTATGCTSFAVTGSGSQYTITVTSEEQKTVTIVLANTITDLATPANAFAGQTLSYTTGDFTAPMLVSATATPTTYNDPTYVMTFNEKVDFGTAGYLNVYKKSNGSLALSIPVTAAMVSDKVVTVKNIYDPAKKNGLDKNTEYYVLVDGGIVKDAAGNTSTPVTDVNYWTFKTGADFATEIVEPIDNSLAFKVYPNPFVDYVTVENASELTKLVVTNIAGQVVKEVVTPDNKIQLNELRSGVYFMSLYKGNTVVSTVKIVKR